MYSLLLFLLTVLPMNELIIGELSLSKESPAGSSSNMNLENLNEMDIQELTREKISSERFDSLNVRFVGNWPFGYSYAAEIDSARNLAFCGSGGGIYILDVSTTESPVKLSEIRTRGVVHGLLYEKSNQRLYIAAEKAGLEIWNVANSGNPEKLGSYDTPGEAWSVAVSSDYVFVADYVAGLQIYRNLLSGIEVEYKDGEKVLKVNQNLFLSTAEVALSGAEFPITLNMFDITGRVREKTIIYNSSPVNIGADLAPGIYFVRVEGFEPAKITKLR
jgi:hypothetical protein